MFVGGHASFLHYPRWWAWNHRSLLVRRGAHWRLAGRVSEPCPSEPDSVRWRRERRLSSNLYMFDRITMSAHSTFSSFLSGFFGVWFLYSAPPNNRICFSRTHLLTNSLTHIRTPFLCVCVLPAHPPSLSRAQNASRFLLISLSFRVAVHLWYHLKRNEYSRLPVWLLPSIHFPLFESRSLASQCTPPPRSLEISSAIIESCFILILVYRRISYHIS